MTTHVANELAPLEESPPEKVSGAVQGGRLVRYRATITMDEQASGDDIILAHVPGNLNFAFGIINASATLSTATIAIGYGASANEYRAAATFTAAAPTFFGPAAAVADDPNPGVRTVRALIGVAALPSSGTLVIDLYYSKT